MDFIGIISNTSFYFFNEKKNSYLIVLNIILVTAVVTEP